ncbi:MAG: hypothetical protein KGJ98_08320 [Chloroflexota bacterium]|nr:hypothetical protein [Chloroflexota bacterium]MDE3102226.1 hypothetical protein [Chloroflexota bacterium]
MTPRRGLVLVLAIVLGVALALGMWGEAPSAPRLSDDGYISIAISQPQVFHPTPGGGTNVSAQVVEKSSTQVVVEVVSDNTRYRVVIDRRTNEVTDVTPEP